MNIKFNFNQVSRPALSEYKTEADFNKAIEEYNDQKKQLTERGLPFDLVTEKNEADEEIEVGFKRQPIEVDPTLPTLEELIDAPGGVTALNNLIRDVAKKAIKDDVVATGKAPESVSSADIIANLIKTSKAGGKVTAEGLGQAIEIMRQYLTEQERPEKAIEAMLQGLGNNEKKSILPKASVLKVWGTKTETVLGYVQEAAETYEMSPEAEVVFSTWESKMSGFLDELKKDVETVEMF